MQSLQFFLRKQKVTPTPQVAILIYYIVQIICTIFKFNFPRDDASTKNSICSFLFSRLYSIQLHQATSQHPAREMTGRELQLQNNHSSSPEKINIMTGRELQLQYNHSSSPQRQCSDNHIQKWIQKDYLQNPVFE